MRLATVLMLLVSTTLCLGCGDGFTAVTGVVKSTDKSPIEGASVTLFEGRFPIHDTMKSDESGHFSVGGVHSPVRRVSLHVEKSGFEPYTQDFLATQSYEDVEVVLKAARKEMDDADFENREPGVIDFE